jgi:hypothetical protein
LRRITQHRLVRPDLHQGLGREGDLPAHPDRRAVVPVTALVNAEALVTVPVSPPAPPVVPAASAAAAETRRENRAVLVIRHLEAGVGPASRKRERGDGSVLRFSANPVNDLQSFR